MVRSSQQEIPLFSIEAVLFSSNYSLHRDLKRLFTNEPSYAIDYYGLLIERGGLRQACEHAMAAFIACCLKSAKFSNPACFDNACAKNIARNLCSVKSRTYVTTARYLSLPLKGK